jgi:ferric-dicitrate binding protein FerR (iron transport regulator)
MKHYPDFTSEDFALDESFQRWVLRPDPATAAFWENWLERHPEKSATVTQARQMLLAVQPEEAWLSDPEAADMWREVKHRTAAAGDPVRQTTVPAASRRLFAGRPTWQKLAAGFTGILLVAGIVAWLFQWNHQPTYYETAYGETKTIGLPDGSVVNLNAHSSLRLTGDWSDGQDREVVLTGEAFFSVVKKSSPTGRRKFRVRTRDLNVEVLGTEFNVASRSQRTQVVLQTGKVSLRLHQAPAREVVMQPGELFEYAPARRLPAKRKVSLAPYVSWREQKLILIDKPLSEVARQLEETYGLPVVIRGEGLAGLRLNGTFPTQSREKLLEALAITAEVQIHLRDDQILIEP